jgi:hypothetical protein
MADKLIPRSELFTSQGFKKRGEEISQRKKLEKSYIEEYFIKL